MSVLTSSTERLQQAKHCCLASFSAAVAHVRACMTDHGMRQPCMAVARTHGMLVRYPAAAMQACTCLHATWNMHPGRSTARVACRACLLILLQAPPASYMLPAHARLLLLDVPFRSTSWLQLSWAGGW